MATNPFSPHGSKGPIRSNAALLAILGVGGGLMFWLRSSRAERANYVSQAGLQHATDTKRNGGL
ncbi:hypothetical protein CB0940_00069 [Cercospora beticola]|uniref:Uncharacterized protein n=1 Tax=Cercospora beticola TaxID=122368 RepID=A0A2G5IAF4_CERBT|nr:hypothetical protein CB0940_00069 [Cercospora beticola]PIB01730.1 hypothetical protein CB0940_00069 [Cercospora beticola]